MTAGTEPTLTLADSRAECSHEDFPGEVCLGCGDHIDAYGNTAYDFRHCSFPDCGCDGARLCMAGEPNKAAQGGNVEGMWSGKTPEQRKGVFDLMKLIHEEKK